MARSLATSWSPAPVVAAAAAWLAAGAGAVALPVTIAPRVAIPAVASHRPVQPAAWVGAVRVYDELDRRARGFAPEKRAGLARAILEESARARLAPFLVLAVIEAESGYDVGAVSPAGAVGLMQLMLPTLREELALAGYSAIDPFDPDTNVRAGVRYLGKLVDDFSNLELALMAYNAGPNRIRHHLEGGGVPERFHGYPRDVLRRLARMAPPRARLAAHLRGVSRPVAVAAHRAHAAGAALVADAPARTARSVPARAVRAEDTCVRLEPGLPISRGRDRPRPVERSLPS
jgi:soluble lytic murein transglycosylase-like protein